MIKYVCSVCGYLYDQAKGDPEQGIAPGTEWNDIHDDWVCPLCGATKAEFIMQDEAAKPEVKKAVAKKTPSVIEETTDMIELTPLEISALCSSLARGCEKQYKPREEALFRELAEYYKGKSTPVKDSNFSKLIELVEKDLTEELPNANEAANKANDRGAKRALVWSDKVTRILKSLLTRYEKDGNLMIENTGVYVCTICGFIYIGDKLPEVCPICKVPNWKFEKIEGRIAHA